MSEVTEEQKCLFDINLTYIGEDGLNRYRNINQITIGEEKLSPEKYNDDDKMICESAYQLEIFFSIEETVEDKSIEPSKITYRFMWDVQGAPWYDYFKANVDKEEPNYQEQFRFILLIQSVIIKKLSFDNIAKFKDVKND